MAVPPMFTVSSRVLIWLRASISLCRLAAQASNSWPRVMGTASCSWVRPILMMCRNSAPLARRSATKPAISVTSSRLAKAMANFKADG